jgi:RNA polymerase sigma-70 factor, ECF subfamily
MTSAPRPAVDIAKPLNDQASLPSDPAEEARLRHEEEYRKRHEDDENVELARQGDRAAFEALFQKYNRRAYAVAIGVVKRPEDAVDVVQESFIKVHKHIATFQGQSSFYTWLYRIVMNLSIDYLRKRRKITEWGDDVRAEDADGDGALVPRLPDANPSKATSRHELNEKIHAALATLPEIHKAVILLREVEGLSYEEMAQALDVPKGTIMSRLFHARRKMQEQLGPYLEGDLDIAE